MRTCRLLVVVVLVWLIAGQAHVLAQDELPSPAKERNAALVYWQYRHQASDSDLFPLVNSDWGGDAVWMPGEAMCKSLADNQDIVAKLLRATSQQKCDWGVEHERGLDAALPHISMARVATRVLRADTRRLAETGDMSGATDRIAGLFGLARHFHQPGASVIERNVAASIALTATSEAQWLANYGKLGPEDSARLFAALEEIVAVPDPFGFVEGIKSCRERLQNDLYLEVHSRMEKKLMTKEMTDAEREAKRQAIHDSVVKVVRSLTPPVAKALNEAAEAWTKDNAVEVLTAIWDRKEELGLASILLPKLQDFKKSELKVIARAADVMALFPEEIQKQVPQEVRDPENKPPRS